MNWFGLVVLSIILFVGWLVLRPKKSKSTKRSSFWSKYGYNAQRDTPAYHEWREKVLKKYRKCVICGTKQNLHCHHIVPFSVNRWKRYSVSNGIVLCEHHHSLYHSEYDISECNNKTLKKFIKKYKV